MKVRPAAPFAAVPLAVVLLAAAAPAGRAQSLADGAGAAAIRPYRGRNVQVFTELPPATAARVTGAVSDAVASAGTIFGVRRTPPVRAFVWGSPSGWPVEQVPPGAQAALRGGPPHIQTQWNRMTSTYTIAGVEYGRESEDDKSAVVWSPADEGRPQTAAVAAVAALTLTDAPDWYVHGAAELARYAERGETAVRISPEDLLFLTSVERPTLREAVESSARPTDPPADRIRAASQWRWALAHLAAFNPNFQDRFALIGPSLTAERPVDFDLAFGDVEPQLTFEWNQFLDHLAQGLDPAATAWEWDANARPLGARRATARVSADAGWQPAKVSVTAGQRIAFGADGTTTVGPDEPRPAAVDPLAEPDPAAARDARRRREPGDPLTADGGPDGRGRLVAAVFDPDLLVLSEPFELGSAGTVTAPASGQLVLRVRDGWGQLDDNRGRLTVKLSEAD